jgi:hypothetical protein
MKGDADLILRDRVLNIHCIKYNSGNTFRHSFFVCIWAASLIAMSLPINL